MKKIFAVIAAAAVCLSLTACGASNDANMSPDYGYNDMAGGMPNGAGGADYGEDMSDPNYNYNGIIENGFNNVSDMPSSYFSLDRNTATYSFVRSQLNYGAKIAPDSVRIEEMINYFDYDFPAPEDKAIGVSAYLSDCPWNEQNKLMMVGLKSVEYNLADVNSNYVFLVDVSGSMSGDLRIGLAKKGLNMLVDELGDNDLVSIVTYASGVNTVLDGAECSDSGKAQIKSKISSFTASGSTNGSGGIQLAYEVAQKHFITGGNNRVIIITDGDFNVGISNQTQLKEFIQDKATSGVYLSVIGVGMGNMRDDFMETLATNGNGNYAYLDNETEAYKVFVNDLNGLLKTVAKDAKAGVTFTENVVSYRLIGYDTKIISEDDFNNENADTGEIGSNLCVAALYELLLAEDYGDGKLADVEVRYKDVTGEEEISESVTLEVSLSTPSSDDLSFISCVAEFGLVLRNSEYKGTAAISAVLARLEGLSEYVNSDAYKQEFVTLVGIASESSYYN